MPVVSAKTVKFGKRFIGEGQGWYLIRQAFECGGIGSASLYLILMIRDDVE